VPGLARARDELGERRGDDLVDGQRDVRRLDRSQGLEALRADVDVDRHVDAESELGDGDHGDGRLVREALDRERALALARDEHGRVENPPHSSSIVSGSASASSLPSPASACVSPCTTR
jgi:hypothetical protein